MTDTEGTSNQSEMERKWMLPDVEEGNTPAVVADPSAEEKPMDYGTVPIETDCKYCHSHIITTVEKIPPKYAVLACLLPVYGEICVKYVHLCPACRHFIGLGEPDKEFALPWNKYRS